jgi:hypothetical protein
MKILAIDLDKFNSVVCSSDTTTHSSESETIAAGWQSSTPSPIARASCRQFAVSNERSLSPTHSKTT